MLQLISDGVPENPGGNSAAVVNEAVILLSGPTAGLPSKWSK
jgi:hypothetical protein